MHTPINGDTIGYMCTGIKRNDRINDVIITYDSAVDMAKILGLKNAAKVV